MTPPIDHNLARLLDNKLQQAMLHIDTEPDRAKTCLREAAALLGDLSREK